MTPALAELAKLERWVCWRYEERDGKRTKAPRTADGRRLASSTNPQTWSSFAACERAVLEGRADGYGVVLDGSDDLIGIDLDHCLDDGELAPWAREIAERLNSYTEITPSVHGVRIFCRGSIPVDGRKRGDLEVYRAKRFLTVTGEHLAGFPDRIEDRTEAVAALYRERFGDAPKGNGRDGDGDWPELPEPLPEAEALAFAQPVLEREYPSTSECDLALAGLARRHNWPRERAAALLRAVRQDHKADRPDYIWRTVGLGYAEAPEAAPEAADIDLGQLVERAKADPGAPFEPEAVDFLGALHTRDPAAYERARARLKAHKVRVSALDDLILQRQPEAEKPGRGRRLILTPIEPWPEPVDGVALIANLVDQLTRFVVLTDHAALACALWLLHAHAHDAAFISPRLVALSPTKRCGKSVLLRVLARLAPRPLPTSNISPSAIFRVIEASSPSLFIDELSNVGDRDRATEIRGIVNSSHCRADAFTTRNVPAGDGWEPRQFSTWAPMVLALIKHVDDQIGDRSIIVPMQRKARDQVTARLRSDQDLGFAELTRKAARWAGDHLEELRRADPEVPGELNDRAADNWRCLLAVADAAGGDWGSAARRAAIGLAVEHEDEEVIGVALLADLREVFGRQSFIATVDLIGSLCGLPERPWSAFGRSGKPITPVQLAKLLRPFGVRSRQKRIGAVRERGFSRSQLARLWARYLPPSLRGQMTRDPVTMADFCGFERFQPVTACHRLHRLCLRVSAGCHGVTG